MQARHVGRVHLAQRHILSLEKHNSESVSCDCEERFKRLLRCHRLSDCGAVASTKPNTIVVCSRRLIASTTRPGHENDKISNGESLAHKTEFQFSQSAITHLPFFLVMYTKSVPITQVTQISSACNIRSLLSMCCSLFSGLRLMVEKCTIR